MVVKLLKCEVDNCSVGYINRMQIAVASLFVISQNLAEVIYSTRVNLVDKIAIQFSRGKEQSIHAYNRVYRIANETLSLGVMIPNSGDTHAFVNQATAEKELTTLFKDQFKSPYTFFKNITKTIKQELAYFGYNGKRTEYKFTEYEKFKEYLEKILELKTSYTDLFIVDHGKIADINWDLVHQRLLSLIHKSGYFDSKPHYSNVISADETEIFLDSCRLALIEDPESLFDQIPLITRLSTGNKIELLTEPKKGLIALSLKYQNSKKIEACAYLASQLSVNHFINEFVIARSFEKSINNNHFDQTRFISNFLMNDQFKFAKVLSLTQLASDNLFLWLLKNDVDDCLFLQLPDAIPLLSEALLFSTDCAGKNCLMLAFDHCPIILPLLLQTIGTLPANRTLETMTDFIIHIKDLLGDIETTNPDLLGNIFKSIRSLGQIENKHRLKPVFTRLLMVLPHIITNPELTEKIAFSIYHCMPIETFINEHNKPIGLPYFAAFNRHHANHLMDSYIASLHRRIERNENYTSFVGFLFGDSAVNKLAAALAIKQNPMSKPLNAACSGRLSAVAAIYRSCQPLLGADNKDLRVIFCKDS